jgi:hypothetical protein
MKEDQLQVISKDPQVSQSVNLNLQAADLIDLYIQEKKDELLSKASGLLQQIKALQTRINDLHGAPEKVVEEWFRKNYAKHIKSFGETVGIRFSIGSEPLYEEREYGAYTLSHKSDYLIEHLEEIFETKGGLSIYKNSERRYERKIQSVIIAGKSFELALFPNKVSELKHLDSLIQKDYNSIIKTEENKIILLKELETIYGEYKTLNNSKKVKAKFTKKALSQTPGGSRILDMISNLDTPLLGK